MYSPAGGEAAAPAAPSAAAAEAKAGAQQLVERGAELAAGGQFAAAAALFEQAVAAAPPGDAAVHEMLAQCRMELGDDEGAYEAAVAAVQLRPGWRAALLTLGRAARNTGRLREAAAALSSYLDEDGTAAAAGSATQAAAVGGRTTEGKGEVGEQHPQHAQHAQQQQSEEDVEEAAAVAAAVQQELEEVKRLLQLQLGHQLGLPGLRLPQQHGGGAGPAGVAWEAGALLAWFLVQQARQAGGAGEAGEAAPVQAASPPCAHGTNTGGVATCTNSQPPSGGIACTPGKYSTHATCGMHCSPGTGDSGSSELPAVAASSPMNRTGGTPAAASVLEGCRVLELGSGTGLVGLAAACLGASVAATDLPEVVPQLEAAAALNAGMIGAAGGSLHAAALDWRQPSPALLRPAEVAGAAGPAGSEGPEGQDGQQYDWLLGADLVYSLPPVAPLVATVAAAAEARAAGSGGAPLKILLAHKHRHEEVDAALLGGLRAAGIALRAVLRDSGSRCTVYVNDAAAAALRAAAVSL